jgi:hypothetical protein
MAPTGRAAVRQHPGLDCQGAQARIARDELHKYRDQVSAVNTSKNQGAEKSRIDQVGKRHSRFIAAARTEA